MRDWSEWYTTFLPIAASRGRSTIFGGTAMYDQWPATYLVTYNCAATSSTIDKGCQFVVTLTWRRKHTCKYSKYGFSFDFVNFEGELKWLLLAFDRSFETFKACHLFYFFYCRSFMMRTLSWVPSFWVRYVSSSSWCVVKTMKKKWKLEISWITSKRMQCRQGMSPPRFLARLTYRCTLKLTKL